MLEKDVCLFSNINKQIFIIFGMLCMYIYINGDGSSEWQGSTATPSFGCAACAMSSQSALACQKSFCWEPHVM